MGGILFFVYSHSKPVCLICIATAALTKKGNLERHLKKGHESDERDFLAQTSLHATKIRELKAQLAAPSRAVNLHQNPEPRVTP